MSKLKNNKNIISYGKWGVFFILPFFIVYAIFSLVPLISTFYNSFFENYQVGLDTVGPNYIGIQNFKTLFTDNSLVTYFSNTMIMWLLGFIPQIVVSLILASWFTNIRLKLKATGVFKTIIYMPNLIMAAAFSMLFWSIFSDIGPISDMIKSITHSSDTVQIMASTEGNRGLVALMNFLMWYGNTTILLMAGIMGIDTQLYEAAEIDGASSSQAFRKITLPLLRPILLYVILTSLIGGLQMFDVPQILTNGLGVPNRTSMTLIMFLNNHLYSKNYGMAGALSVILFAVAGILSLIVFFGFTNRDRKGQR